MAYESVSSELAKRRLTDQESLLRQHFGHAGYANLSLRIALGSADAFDAFLCRARFVKWLIATGRLSDQIS